MMNDSKYQKTILISAATSVIVFVLLFLIAGYLLFANQRKIFDYVVSRAVSEE
ncbi:MAG: hypothetical protein G01um1014107_344, partial [Parcubacteria group bacterium Gr01-1014_107]